MIKTQIQFPDPLYHDLKRLAGERDQSMAEVVRRATERYVAQYPPERTPAPRWQLPDALDMGGDFLIDPTPFRAEADAIEMKASDVGRE